MRHCWFWFVNTLKLATSGRYALVGFSETWRLPCTALRGRDSRLLRRHKLRQSTALSLAFVGASS